MTAPPSLQEVSYSLVVRVKHIMSESVIKLYKVPITGPLLYTKVKSKQANLLHHYT